MKIGDKFTNGGIIPAYGNEKPAAQLIDELSERNRRYRQLLNKLAALDEKDKKYKCVAGLIVDVKNLLNNNQ